jgi:RNA-directed DNA polymerase
LDKAKSFDISKHVVLEAYNQVKKNHGAAGIDKETIDEFEKNWKDNLYRIWNRMSSGTYFPPPVRAVEIDKKSGGKRTLGIPTVSDRIAQTVVKMTLEPKVDGKFHRDSYGYRPGKSALDAVRTARERCWRYNWVIDLDIKGFFDNLEHDLVMNAVRHHTDSKWMLLYIQRWLKADHQLEDGTLQQRDRGTPQGGVISPLLANMFMHHAFDTWMAEQYPKVPFERYADDVIVHCTSLEEAGAVLEAIRARLKRCKLELHPQKTKLVYCKDSNRKGSYEHEQFDFLGYRFRPRRTKAKTGQVFDSFGPAVSPSALKEIGETIRGWRLHLRSATTLAQLAIEINAVTQGWINYYGLYWQYILCTALKRINAYLVRWARRKYKRLKTQKAGAWRWLARVKQQSPGLFAHWRYGLRPLT